jgi:hypothetical protein
VREPLRREDFRLAIVGLPRWEDASVAFRAGHNRRVVPHSRVLHGAGEYLASFAHSLLRTGRMAQNRFDKRAALNARKSR